jgi:predicted metal-dependent enzyme (double-stranded beta helix superfamily)
MFDLEAFIEDCRRLVGEPHAPRHVLELMRETVANPPEVAAAVEPLAPKVGVLDAPLFRSPELTVLNVTLRGGMLSIPHDHAMWAVIGIYEGEEQNTFYRRGDAGLEETNRRTIHTGEAILLGEEVVHAIENPLTSPTRGLHVYGGDLIGAARSMWDPAAGGEHPYDIPQFYRWSADLARSRKAAAAALLTREA